MRSLDIVAVDARGDAVLVVEVKARPLDELAARRILESLGHSGLPARYGMVADLKRIRLADFEARPTPDFVCEFESADILREYDPGFGTKDIFEDYLTTLVDAWLRDLVYHWNSQAPPGSERLAATGLLDRLKDGDTRREVTVGAHLVR